MATGTRTADDPLAVAGWGDHGPDSKSERYLARRLAEAGAEVKGVALTTIVLSAGVAGMIWLLVGVLVEHWLVPGGLPPWARWTWLAIAVAAAAFAAWRWILPIVRSRVNLVYAARAIEREHPELHNDVVNAVLARRRAEETTPMVLRSLRRRAARQLSKVPGEGVMDRTLSLRLAAILAALVVAAVVYELAAPKSLLASTARLVAPWLGISAPARVWIDRPALAWRQPGAPPTDDAQHRVDVVEGVATHVRGRQLVVGVAVEGLAKGEKPVAVVTPRREGGVAQSWQVPLVPGAEGRFSACLPDESRGLDQSIDLVIAAGDARSAPIRVAVVDTPALLVREVTYHFPTYTAQPDETVEWQGDLRALEGTEVTLVAESNHPLDAAWIDFDGDGRSDVPLKGGQRDLARVRGRFTLRLDADRTGPEHASYRLMFLPKAASLAQGREPVIDRMEYRIDVLPDLAPEVAVTEPTEKACRVPPGAPVTVRIKAVDPDFGLTSVVVETRLRGGEARQGRELFAGGGASFLGDDVLVPEQLGAGPGDVLEYRAVAKDNRPGQPNVGESEWRTLVIDPSAAPRPAPPPKPAAGGSGGDGGKDPEAANGDPQGRDGAEGKRDGAGGRDADPAQAAGRDPGGKPDAGGQDGGPQDRGAAPQKPDGRQPEAEQPQRPGERPQKSADSGQAAEQEPKSRQKDPKTSPEQGQPEQGEDQGSADGGKPQQGMEGKSGNDAGQRQQDGSSDGGGTQPQGQGGAGQQGDQQGGKPEGRGGQGGQDRDPKGGDPKATAGGKEGRPDARAGGESKATDAAADGTQQGERGKGRGRDAKDAKQETVASDGTDDGEAMERILEHRKKSGQGQADQPSADGQQKSKEGRQEQGQKQGQDGKPSPQDDGQPQQPPACAGEDGMPCGKEGCSSCNGGSAGGTGGSGTSAAGGEQAGGEKAGGEQAGGEQAGGEKAGGEKAGGEKAGGEKAGGEKAGEAPADGEAGEQQGSIGAGGQVGGGDRQQAGAAGERRDRPLEWSEQDLSHARNAADMAIEHLRDAVTSGDTEVLDELGWTPDDARAFLARWERMRQAAKDGDPRAQGEFDRAVQSLGMRPTRVQSSRDVPADVKGGQAEGRRSRPPSDYREQFRAFMQGAAAE